MATKIEIQTLYVNELYDMIVSRIKRYRLREVGYI